MAAPLRPHQQETCAECGARLRVIEFTKRHGDVEGDSDQLVCSSDASHEALGREDLHAPKGDHRAAIVAASDAGYTNPSVTYGPDGFWLEVDDPNDSLVDVVWSVDPMAGPSPLPMDLARSGQLAS